MSLPKLKKAYEKGTRGISWGPLLTPGPRAVPEWLNSQSTPASVLFATLTSVLLTSDPWTVTTDSCVT
ncbi:unnamed protein product [Staurois parvus]|uniref:Uncharacterized protein n=1 Tax=Staurois parvus TaxID=386267 RepID=A0ABN9C3L0_9NEOB|nr:unnamed protein product [Staurois parvus]